MSCKKGKIFLFLLVAGVILYITYISFKVPYNISEGASCEAARKCVMFPLENGSNSVFISKLLTYSREILSGNT